MMKRKMTPKSLTVVSTQKLSDSFLRIRFTGDDLQKMPEDCEGDYIKLIFNANGTTNIDDISETGRPLMRTYTIRHFDSAALTLDVDFVLHGSQNQDGIASHWAQTAKAGDTIKVGGPGHSETIPFDLHDYVFVADMTSLPALAVTLTKLTPDAKGRAFIQIADASDKQELEAPQGIDIEWLLGDHQQPLLAKSVESLTSVPSNAGVWCACEFSQMRAVRRHVSDNWSCARENTYFSSYWKHGVTEDGHKALKRQDAESFNQA
ncbi:siderophore-interacting protein [Vibrio astriarenae]|uniref:siderophore-interacting protein n=1 Tax=Vibrio astriarenae TaxID=1481923 RepID=UPI0037364E63